MKPEVYTKSKPKDNHTDFYVNYLASAEWAERRAAFIKEVGERCERCGDTNGPLEVHHLHYRTLGDEDIEDVKVLCSKCHKTADTLRRRNPWRDWFNGDYEDDWDDADGDE